MLGMHPLCLNLIYFSFTNWSHHIKEMRFKITHNQPLGLPREELHCRGLWARRQTFNRNSLDPWVSRTVSAWLRWDNAGTALPPQSTTFHMLGYRHHISGVVEQTLGSQRKKSSWRKSRNRLFYAAKCYIIEYFAYFAMRWCLCLGKKNHFLLAWSPKYPSQYHWCSIKGLGFFVNR